MIWLCWLVLLRCIAWEALAWGKLETWNRDRHDWDDFGVVRLCWLCRQSHCESEGCEGEKEFHGDFCLSFASLCVFELQKSRTIRSICISGREI